MLFLFTMHTPLFEIYFGILNYMNTMQKITFRNLLSDDKTDKTSK